MTVCAQRSDDPGFFTPCHTRDRTCVCGQQVRADLAAQAAAPSTPSQED